MKKPFFGMILAVSIGLSAINVAESAGKGSAASSVLQAGINNYNRGYIAKAVPYFEKATQQTPGSETAWLWLARAHQKQGTPANFEKAKLAFQKVLALNPNNTEALSSLGELWSWEPTRRDEAIQLLKRAYEINPADAATAKKLAEALFWQGNAADALQYAAPIAHRYEKDRKFMGEYAQMLSQTGRAEEALIIYNTVLKNESSRDPSTKLQLARAFLKDGQPEKAQALYEEINQAVDGGALSRDPNFAQSMASLAFDLGLPGESLRWDQSLPPALQRQKDIQLRMIRACIRTGRKPEAIEKLQRLYEADLLDTNEKLEYADYLGQLNLEPDALPAPNLLETLYQDALRDAPDNGEVYLRLARLYAEKDNSFEQVVQIYQQALGRENLSSRGTVKREFLDFLKSDKTQQTRVDAIFQQLLSESPNDAEVQTAYAEFLSWQSDRRAEALRMYIELAKAHPEQTEMWESRIEEVLKWHKPSTDLIPIYQEIVNLYPQSKSIWMTVARAYRNDKNYYREAVETYSIMIQRYPNDSTLKREWLDLLIANSSQRGENIRLLQKMNQENPSDLDILATYGKLLSYEHKYGPAIQAFDEVLNQNPEHFEALVGKGYVILWSGRKFEAKNYFSQLRQKYPDNVDIAIGLAQTEKMIGRYDAAIKIIEEIRPLMQKNPESGFAPTLNPDFIPVEYISEKSLLAQATYDFSILPYGGGNPATPASRETTPRMAPVFIRPQTVQEEHTAKNMELSSSPTAVSTQAPSELRSLQSEVDALTDAVNSLKALQQSSRRQLDKIGQSVNTTRDIASGATYLQADETLTAGSSNFSKKTVGESGMTPVYGTYAALDYDTNPLLSGMGRFKNDEVSDLEKGLLNELRPMVRVGYLYSTQDGEKTTTGMNSWGFPNQLSFSLTPQIRLRGGMRPVKYYLPDGVKPNSTWGWEYGFGTTVKYWDRLTLDGDMAITHFSQSRSTNLTFQTQATYAFNDSIALKLGVRRMPQYNSLLSVAGLRPSLGAFRNELVGQARENTVYGELNIHPFSPNIDWNLGYEWGFVDGEHIPRNFKNQAFTSAGYTWHYASNHQVRLGYEFLYFGYGKNATNGYFDTTALGLTRPLASLKPITVANSGYVFGGYYSPTLFIMNAGRLDFRGSLFNKFLEYKLGGSLGAQTIRLGHHLDRREDGGGTKLASSFDGNLIMNLTDWLAAYGSVDFLNAGQQFSRWRFGGGLILRPHIAPLSPMFGQPIDQRR
jgi:tetratricopeptide (TPR) repeat protein